jgi:hypothetical protein
MPKSILNPAFMKRLVERLPGHHAAVLDTACCGMAGAFGALAEKYDLSIQVAQDLIDKLENQSRETQIIASGTSLPASNQRSHKYPAEAYGRSTGRSPSVVVVRQLQRARSVSVIDYGKPHPGLDAMNPVVASDKLKRTEGPEPRTMSQFIGLGAFRVYGGHGTTASSNDRL